MDSAILVSLILLIPFQIVTATASTVQIREQLNTTAASCPGYVSTIRDPENHPIRYGPAGWWGRDPTTGHYWVTSGYYNLCCAREYASFEDIREDNEIQEVRFWKRMDGNGAVIYNRHIIYYSHPKILGMYNMNTGRSRAWSAKYLSACNYQDDSQNATFQWTGEGYGCVDFAVDEQGLWMVYGDKTTHQVRIAKMNPSNFARIQIWEGTRMMKQIGETFMVCGVLYAMYPIDTGREPSNILYIFDTNKLKGHGQERTLEAGILPVPIMNKPMTFISNLHYNPDDRKIYAWNRGQLQVYTADFSDQPVWI